MTKKDQRDAGPKFAPICAEKPKNSERAMTSRELKNLYYLKKEIKQQQRRIAELEAAATIVQQRLLAYRAVKAALTKSVIMPLKLLI